MNFLNERQAFEDLRKVLRIYAGARQDRELHATLK